jgi:hypothetical protein
MSIKTKLTAVAVLTTLSMSANAAHQSFDSRSHAMGGIGVSTSDYLTSAFHNPALGARYTESDDVGVLIPSVGAQFNDSDDVINKADDFSSIYDAFEANPADPNNQDAMVSALKDLDGSMAFAQAGAGLAVAIPNSFVSVNVFAKAYADALVVADVDESDITNPDPNNFNSRAVGMGVSIMEGGVALSHAYNLNSGTLYVGVTPKFQQINTINYVVGLENFDMDDWDNDRYQNEKSNFNMDLGVAYELPQGFVFGLSGRNLISQTYQTQSIDGVSGEYELTPMITGSASFNHSLFTVGVDVDFTENERYTTISGVDGVNADDDNTQMLAVGTEFNAWDWAQLRAGYQHDLSGNLDGQVTAGIGLSPFGTVRIDVSASYGGENNFGAVAQTYFTF